MAEKLENMAAETEESKAAAGKPETRKKKGRKRKTVKRLIWTLVILLAVGVAAWSVYSKLKAEYNLSYDPYTATTGSISNSLSFTGSMQLVNSATYTASAEAKVKEVYVAVGDKVREGDRLVRLSGGETIEAEFDGTVSAVEAEKGDEVKAEAALVTVADFDHMTVSVRVGESNISQVSVGQRCRVTVSSAGAVFDSEIGKIIANAMDKVGKDGTITVEEAKTIETTLDVVEGMQFDKGYLSPYFVNNAAYYTAKVDVDTSESENVWPGMQATVTVPLEEAKDVTVLKMEALSTARDNTAYVYKENEAGEMEKVTVTVGVSNGKYVEIKDGIASGETVFKVAEKTEEETGLAALFSGLFTNRQVNRPGRSGNGGMPDYGNTDMGNMPGGFGGGSRSPGGGSGSGGGSRGN